MNLRFITSALALLLTPFQAPQQQAQRPSGVIEGVVVRLGSTEPIAGVDVDLTRIEGTKDFPLGELVIPPGTFSPGAVVRPSAPNPADQGLVRTKDDGRFRFTGLRPGKYQLLAGRAGGIYVAAEFGQRDWKGPGLNITLGENQTLRDARIEMAPTGTISGRVADDSGSPAGRVRVMAIDASYKYGKESLGIVQSTLTDDRGEYRMFWLPPGRYFLSAQPVDPRMRSLTALIFPPGLSDPSRESNLSATIRRRMTTSRELIEEVFAPVFYGGGTDIARARNVDLAPGNNLNAIDLQLAGGWQPARRVRGVIVDPSGRRAPQASIRAVPRIDGPSVAIPTNVRSPDGSFELAGLGPGAYVLVANLVPAVPPGTTAPRLGANIAIPPGSENIDNLTIVVTTGASAKVRLTVEGPPESVKEPDAMGLAISLVSDWPFLGGTTAPSLKDGITILPDIRTGDYHMRVAPLLDVYNGPGSSISQSLGPFRDFYVKSIRLAATDILNDGLHVDQSIDGEIQLIISSNGGVLEGQVEDPGRGPLANATVVIVPEGAARARADLFKIVHSDQDGRYSIHGITPGDYRIFAWDRVEDGIWFAPTFMQTSGGAGRRVTLNEGPNPPMNFRVVRQ